MTTLSAARPVRRLAAFFAAHRVLYAVLLSFFLNLVLESFCRRSWSGGVRFLWNAPMPWRACSAAGAS